MWRKELTLLLLTVSAVLILGQKTVFLDNTKTQKSVVISSGSSLTLICNLTTETYQRYRVNFSFNAFGSASNHSTSKILSEKMFFESGSTPEKESKAEEDVLKHTLLNATIEDSGWYSCSIGVEIPFIKNVFSDKTNITVANKEPTTYPRLVTSIPGTSVPDPGLDWLMWMLLAISAVILIVLLIICIMLRRKYRRHREADPIYANTRPKQPSPRPGTAVNTLKKASSSQNVQHQNRAKRHDDGKRRHKP